MYFHNLEPQVAFIIGGNGRSSVELYAPNGTCNKFLAPLPSTGTNFDVILTYINQKIFACGGPYNKKCWQYNVASNSWGTFTDAKFAHDFQTSTTYNNKLYITDDFNPEVFDPATNVWSSWPAPPNRSADGPCLVAWKDSFFMIGGYANRRNFKSFNHTTNAWTVITPGGNPADMVYPGCILLPNNEDILVVGSEEDPYSGAVAIYNIRTNIFQRLANLSNVAGTRLVRLGNRIFATDGHGGPNAFEFNLGNQTWSSITSLKEWRGGHHGIVAVPASLFVNTPGGCIGV